MSSVTCSTASHESFIGPSSELIDIDDFLLSVRNNSAHVFIPPPDFFPQAAESVNPRRQDDIASECGVDDVRSKVTSIFNDPRLYVHARQIHDTAVNSIYDLAERKKSGKRKRKREVLSKLEDTPDLVALKNGLGNIKLRSWPLPQEAAIFIRGPKNSDLNTLTEIKYTKEISNPASHSAVVTVSIYNRLAWSYNFVYRGSQHAVLSSNTLGDLYDVIPCPSNEMPGERTAHGTGTFIGYESGHSKSSSGCVVVIEGTAFGDGRTEPDYASKLISHIPKPLARGSKIHDTPFSSLSLRLNHPYWLVHQGNCEHFLVIDQIRLLHPHDPPSGYPLTTQITPPLIGNCRVCTKVPAVYSVVGDVRLGESPCILCAPCWRNMGMPKGKDSDSVVVIPLPKYEFGW
ncbi:snRNA-activating protein of 50kDa MW C terminal-domain-containing protein [Multifurca ochricompacta]|uniref:snRNA-activating protein of 50kDa MW C terminal-domain-containing protein n=1 Tax=Multifurca ochricompacta TaxID=376703 RepID=A0AAD4M909_9AGAM|nr:snRNA-activating protein of 50kDa MW C terminal-domain-containing protein [Multifurca ochricompacta]